jgi:hypothetical protein
MRGLHYGQELVSTNRPDTFAQTNTPTTTILLAISRRTIHFHGLLFDRAMLDSELHQTAYCAVLARNVRRDRLSMSALAI